MDKTFRKSALDYHQFPIPGKISIKATKPLANQQDLALAYSPGVAAACEEIHDDPLKALDYTSRGNMVAVITNGTAVLGLGNIGALASKPVMEGKSVLFKKFANIDSIDIEVQEEDVDNFVNAVASLEPSFGGINLEDIKAPECFEIERRLKEKMNIPVFHDDQHGTAIIVSAAVLNWLYMTDQNIEEIKLVANGAGASAMACLQLLVEMGMKKENIIVCDRKGVIFKGRKEGMDDMKEQFANDTKARDLGDALENADVFLGLSGPGAVSKEQIASMKDAPLVMALANPTPEIMPEEVREVKPEAVICTGRSDYPNQVNNVLCFPFIFRGALDVGASEINEDMKIACVQALAELTRKEAVAEVAAVYSDEHLKFGPDYVIPKPFDPRLIVDLPIAVANAAMETGVAARPIENWENYRQRLQHFFYRSNLLMRPVFSRAQAEPKRVVYCDGEEESVLRAIQVVLDEGLAKPIVIGRRNVVQTRIKRLHMRMEIDKDFELVDPEDDPRYREYWTTYHKLMERRGVTPAAARTLVRTNTAVIGALMVKKHDADAVICGSVGDFHANMEHVVNVLGLKPGVETAAALNILILSKGTFFICDTHVNPDPSIAQISEMTVMAAEEVRRFGIEPKVALLSNSNFGSHDHDTAYKMRAAYQDLVQRAPGLEIDGEMQADTALSDSVRDTLMPDSTLNGQANLLIMPNVDAANISFNMLKVLGEAISIGPLLLGVAQPATILTPSTSSRGIVNATAIACVNAQVWESENGDIKRKDQISLFKERAAE